MNYSKAILGVAALTAAFAGAVALAPSVYAWGDSDGGRQSYTIDQVNNGVLDGKIVLNSISNSPSVGDERYFVQIREDGTNNNWKTDTLQVETGKTYAVRMFVHNNSRLGTEAKTEKLAAKVTLPKDTATSMKINGALKADNTSPKEVWDDVTVTSDAAFHLEYVSGSGYWDVAGAAKGSLSDKLVNGGVYLGYDKAGDGALPGCYGYSGFVSFKVKVVADQDFQMEKKVRLLSKSQAGDKTWHDAVKANDGDIVEYKITYVNTSKGTEKDVQVKDVLGSNLQYVKGTTYLYNANHKNGIKLDSDKVTTDGINIGDYTAGSNAVVTFQVKVVNGLTAKFGCGADNTLRSTASVRLGGTTLNKNDFVDVIVHPSCPEPDKPTPTPDEPTPTPDVPTPTPDTPTPTPETPRELPNTGVAGIAASVIGAGSVTTSAGAYLVSRKKLGRK